MLTVRYNYKNCNNINVYKMFTLPNILNIYFISYDYDNEHIKIDINNVNSIEGFVAPEFSYPRFQIEVFNDGACYLEIYEKKIED